MKTIELVEKRVVADTKPRFNVMLNRELFGELYFNMRGYVGYLPTPRNGAPGKLTIGEVGITAYRREVAQLNREWKAWNKKNQA